METKVLKQSNAKGYATRPYAYSLAEFGEPVFLKRSGGYLLKRNIPGTPYFDAMGCYPLFFCQDWSGLAADLADLEDLVSVSFVPDPFGAYDIDELKPVFNVVRPFKDHYVVDLNQPLEEIGSRHHRKEALSALKRVKVEVCKRPDQFIPKWCGLYDTLVRRHNINGIRAFSRQTFQQQLSMEDTVVHMAFVGDEVVGAQIYFVQDRVVHCHLGAVNDLGYKTGAFYAMDYYSYQYFGGVADQLDLGGGVGLGASATDGLSRYKQGWASETKPIYFCGKILDNEIYDQLSPLQGVDEGGYFPVYRNGEFH